MGSFAEDKTNLSSHVLRTRHAYVKERADRLEWTVSKFGGKVWDWWFAAGCPVVTEKEAHLPPIPYKGDSPAKPARKLKK